MSLNSLVEHHEGLLWFWALWECAQHCVQSKLKTPLGKPQDTFIAIEGEIKSFYNSSFEEKQSASEWSLDLTRVTLLVHFVEYLEKCIYNAYEGTAVSIPASSAKVTAFLQFIWVIKNFWFVLIKAFFRTNKNTCSDWFARVRYFLIHVCVKSGHFEIAVRNCQEYVQSAMQHNSTNVNI